MLPNGLIGRSAELRALAEVLREGKRLITIVGPPGTGKTRLASHFAQNCDRKTPDWLPGAPARVPNAEVLDIASANHALQIERDALRVNRRLTTGRGTSRGVRSEARRLRRLSVDAVGGGAVPVLLAGLEEDAVTARITSMCRGTARGRRPR